MSQGQIPTCQLDSMLQSKNCAVFSFNTAIVFPCWTVAQQLATVAVCLWSLNASLSKTVRARLGLVVCVCVCLFVWLLLFFLSSGIRVTGHTGPKQVLIVLEEEEPSCTAHYWAKFEVEKCVCVCIHAFVCVCIYTVQGWFYQPSSLLFRLSICVCACVAEEG